MLIFDKFKSAKALTDIFLEYEYFYGVNEAKMFAISATKRSNFNVLAIIWYHTILTLKFKRNNTWTMFVVQRVRPHLSAVYHG